MRAHNAVSRLYVAHMSVLQITRASAGLFAAAFGGLALLSKVRRSAEICSFVKTPRERRATRGTCCRTTRDVQTRVTSAVVTYGITVTLVGPWNWCGASDTVTHGAW